MKKYKSARGVYYDLEKSPFIYIDDNGNVFKFSSEKKLDMFRSKLNIAECKIIEEGKKLEKLGYKITKDYFKPVKDLPKSIYNAMIYK